MQGQGEKSHFLGTPHDLDEAHIVVLPVAFDQTSSYMHGADKGPAAMIEASRNLELFDIETGFTVPKVHTAPFIEADSSQDMIDQTYQRSLNYLIQGKFVVTLGGEHAISHAPIKAHAKHFGAISILQLDAHTDLVPAYEGNPLSHASVMARVKELSNVSSITAVGIRSMAEEEWPLVDKERTFFAHDLKEDWIHRVIDTLSDTVYITFDLDAFDSSLMPSTGTPEPGGLFWNQTMELLRAVSQHKKIIGFDVVELLPLKNFWAPDYLAAKLIYKLLAYTFQENTHDDIRLHEKTFQTL